MGSNVSINTRNTAMIMILFVATMAYAEAVVSPLAFPGLRVWLSADSGVVKDENNLVSKWQDLSGNGHHVTQSDKSLQPKWVPNKRGMRPVIEFNGKPFLDGQLGNLPAPVTVFTLVKFHATHPCPDFVPKGGNPCGEYVYSIGARPNGGYKTGNHISFSRMFRKDFGTGGEGHYYSYWGHQQDPTHGHLFLETKGTGKNRFLVADKWHRFGQQFRDIGQKDNHLIFKEEAIYKPQYASHGQLNLKGEFRVGDWVATKWSWPFIGEIAELIIYNHEFTLSERRQMMTYLACKARGECANVSVRNFGDVRMTHSTAGHSLRYESLNGLNGGIVSYFLPQEMRSSLQLVDSRGRTVRVLHNPATRVGHCRAKISTRAMASGLYLVRLNTGAQNGSFARKIFVLNSGN